MNARMNELQTKISSFNKISDFAKMKVEGSRVISNIRSISKALTKSIGKENKEIINKILTAANGLKKSNAKERIPVIIEALNELYFKELMSNKKTTQMASVIKSLREKRDERNRQKKELAEIKAKVTQQIRKATFALRDLGIKQYSYSEVQRLVAKVRDANSDPKSPNYIGKVSFKISNIFRTAEERGRRKKLSQIKSFITKNSQTKKVNGRTRPKTNIGPDGQALFKAMVDFMELMKDKDLESLATAIRTREALKVAFLKKVNINKQ